MEKKALYFEDFLHDVLPDYAQAVAELHQALTEMGCIVNLQQAKNGFVVSYNHPVSKKVVANFVSRKTGPVIRIYGDHAQRYLDALEDLPEYLLKRIDKASACRRLLDPTKCNARCSMGYDLEIKGTRHIKCRYGCFMFPITPDSTPSIRTLLEREMQARSAS